MGFDLWILRSAFGSPFTRKFESDCSNSFPKTKHPPTHPGPRPSLLPAPVASSFEVTPVKYSDRLRESLECLDPAVLDHGVSGYMSSPLHSFAVQALRDSHRLMVSGNLGTMIPVSYASFAPDSTTASNSKLRASHRLGHRLCCKKLQGGKAGLHRHILGHWCFRPPGLLDWTTGLRLALLHWPCLHQIGVLLAESLFL